MPPVHQCSQIEVIGKIQSKVALTNNDISYMKLEISEIKVELKEFRKDIANFIASIDTKYATKEEVNWLKKDVNTIKTNTTARKLEWIKWWWALLVALISAGSVVLSAYINK